MFTLGDLLKNKTRFHNTCTSNFDGLCVYIDVSHLLKRLDISLYKMHSVKKKVYGFRFKIQIK